MYIIYDYTYPSIQNTIKLTRPQKGTAIITITSRDVIPYEGLEKHRIISQLHVSLLEQLGINGSRKPR